MNKHWWYTVESGMGIICDKCGKYANMMFNDDFSEIEKLEDCPITDVEFLGKEGGITE